MTRSGRIVATALGVVLLVAVALGIFWFGWDWKALIGWRTLVDYIDPKNATGRKDALQVYVLLVAGVVAAITAAVGLANLHLTRRNLEQQRELEAQRADEQRTLEAQRAQGTALQAYYEQIGNLITKDDLRNTQREEIRELARGQTLTVLQELEASRKGSLLTFLHGAGLIGTENPAVVLTGANLEGVALRSADLRGANLQEARLQGANLQEARLQGAFLQGTRLQGANLRKAGLHGAILPGAWLQRANLQGAFLQKADLQGAILPGVDLYGANLQEADLQGASLQAANLQEARLQGADLRGANLQEAGLHDGASLEAANLHGAIMPNGQKYEDWLKDREKRQQDE